MLSNLGYSQEEEIEISSSPLNRDTRNVVKQAFSSFDPGLCTFPMTDAHRYCSTSTGSIEKNLIRFLAVIETTVGYFTNAVLGELERNVLDIQNFCQQEYDSGANMEPSSTPPEGLAKSIFPTVSSGLAPP
ncbi:hypothetical protein TNCV_2994711 [Trichonephila clavipes]|nr:hypothetical protein TNCV_2994711 [Trichonephila clavipes]